MKKFLLIFILLLSVSSCAEPADAENKDAIAKHHVKPSPSWSLTDSAGVEHNFPESEKDKTTIVLFWATWCPYCKSLMPHIQSVLYEYGDELDLQVFALSVFEDGDPAEYINESAYDFVLFENADAITKLYDIHGTPGLLVIDKEGQIRFDLRDVKTDHLKASGNKHWQKARKNAPYWAAELRKVLASL